MLITIISNFSDFFLCSNFDIPRNRIINHLKLIPKSLENVAWLVFCLRVVDE